MAFKKLTSGLMATSMILGLAAQAHADITTATPFETASKMNKLGIVQGVGTNPDGTPNFNLGGNLTRAELVTTIVRSFGADQAAQLAKGAPSFADVTADAWYSGYVAVAKNLAEQNGVAIGRDANHFDPNANVSKAEALVFVMKFLGIKVEASGANWYAAWINKAIELGLISKADADVALANPGTAATRGEAFIILDFGYSAKVLEGGASLYTAFVDKVLPTVTVAKPAETTTDTKVTISGSASDDKAIAAVFVNGTAVTLKDGNFSADVNLSVGANTIEVSAKDIAGNVATSKVTVTRTTADAASIEASDITVAAGATVDVTALVKDANGEAITGATLTGESTVGSYAAGKFTAGTTAGAGKLTLKLGDLTKDVNVTVTAGALAKVVTGDPVAPGTKVTLAATDAYGNAVTGVTYTQTSADALLDATTGTFIASKSGAYEVTATKDGVSVKGTVGVYGAADHLVVNAPVAADKSTDKVVANGATEYTLTVNVADKAGTMVNVYNTGDAGMPDSVTIDSVTGIDFASTPATVAVENGVAKFTFTVQGGLADANVTLNAHFTTAGSTVKGTVSFDTVAQAATSIEIGGAPKFLAVNPEDATTPELSATVLDQAGQPMLDGVYGLHVEVSGAATLGDGKDATDIDWTADGDNTFSIAAKDALTTGAINVKVTGEGLETATATITAAYALDAAKLNLTAPTTTTLSADVVNVGGAADSFDTTKALKYTVAITDANGVPKDAASATLKLDLVGIATADKASIKWSLDGATWHNYATTTSLGTVTGKTSFYIAGAKAGSYTVQVEDSALTGALKASASSAFTVTAGKPANLAWTSNTSVLVLRSADTKTTLKAALSDKNGNVVKDGTVAVTFATPTEGVTLNGKADSVTVTTDANGVASVEVASAIYVDLAQVSISGTKYNDSTTAVAYDSTVAEITADYKIPASISLKLTNTEGTAVPTAIFAGEGLMVNATVKDNYGNAYADLADSDFTVTLNGDVIPAVNDDNSVNYTITGSNGVYAIEFGTNVITKAGTASIKVGINKLVDTKEATASIAVKADINGAISANIVESTVAADSTTHISLAKGVATAFTLQLVDRFGNTVSGSANKSAATIAFDPTAAATGEDGVVHYLVVTNGDNIPMASTSLAAGKNTIKFFVRADAAGTLSIDAGTYGTINLVVDVQ